MRLNEIFARYQDKVHFFVIYTREAHPDDGWRVQENLKQEIFYREPRTDDERTNIAQICQVSLDLKIPMLIDSIDNDVEEKYISLPMRLFLVDQAGHITYTGERGPRGFNPDSWEAAIKNVAT